MTDVFSLVVDLRVHPGRGEEFLAAMTRNAESSVRDEPGCLRFDVNQVEDDHDRFILYELYRDAAAFEIHRATAHFAEWRELAGRLLVDGARSDTRGELIRSFGKDR